MGFLFDKTALLFCLIFLFMTIVIDSQLFIPKEYFHESFVAFRKSYVELFKDPFAASNAPQWAKSLMTFYVVTAVPYYLLAIVAFAKGNCACIRTPSIIYATETITILVPVLTHLWKIPLDGPGVHPKTTEEFYKLFSCYAGLAFYHVVFLLYFLRNSNYGAAPAVTTSHATKKAKRN